MVQILLFHRHFKNITYGANFHVVLETIPSMMNALRMVWIISRHYNRDERMVPLMERIAWELGTFLLSGHMLVSLNPCFLFSRFHDLLFTVVFLSCYIRVHIPFIIIHHFLSATEYHSDADYNSHGWVSSSLSSSLSLSSTILKMG